MSNLTTDVYKDNKFVRHLGPFELEMPKQDICFFTRNNDNGRQSQDKWTSVTFALPYWDYLDLGEK